ncbi:hypothetical protein L3Y34_018865 [Caenorhabditis briggsae]|uniref:Uncharacterized protein n=1 Tax=Caenorhabditis briggsae TaxID=6238 RepID=A0AAE9DPB0_CAEBR|nr:hypothetical protein L3Y34_018865 [Caenorhabditis briggsae]
MKGDDLTLRTTSRISRTVQRNKIKEDAWTPGLSSTTTGTGSKAGIGTIRIRTAAKQNERKCSVSGMHHHPGLRERYQNWQDSH